MTGWKKILIYISVIVFFILIITILSVVIKFKNDKINNLKLQLEKKQTELNIANEILKGYVTIDNDINRITSGAKDVKDFEDFNIISNYFNNWLSNSSS